MEADNDSVVLPVDNSVQPSECPTIWDEANLGGGSDCMQIHSTNVLPSKRASVPQRSETIRQFEERRHIDPPSLHPSENNANREGITQEPPPMYSSLFQKVTYPDKPQSSCHATLHDGNSSIGTLHSTRSASHQHNLHHHSCSSLEYAHPPSHDYYFRSIPIRFDPSHYKLERDCLPHTINDNSNQSFSISKPYQNEANPLSHVHYQNELPFLSSWGMKPPLCQSSTFHASFNNTGRNDGENCDKSSVSMGDDKPRHSSDEGIAATRIYGMTAGNQQLGVNLLTPSGSQISKYNNVLRYTTESPSLVARSHHPSINSINPMSRKGPESESATYPVAENKRSCRPGPNEAQMDTHVDNCTSSHSTDERLWKVVNEHENDSEINRKPEVITSSVNDYVCDISSISSDARYSHPEVDKDLIPGKITLLSTDWAKRKWKYARCFDKMLPKENPSEIDSVSFFTILLKVHEFTSNTISDCLLEYYKKLCLRFNLSYNRAKTGDMISQIQDAVVKSSTEYSDEYLQMCLLFMKYPFVYDFDWFRKAVRIVEEEYSIKIPIYPQNQNFVYSVLVDTRLAVMNNRFRRVMLRQVGKVWYDKKQSKTKTVFGESADLYWEKKEVFVERHIFRGYLASIKGISDNSTTEDFIRNIKEESNSREEFCWKMGEAFWNTSDGSLTAVPRPATSYVKSETNKLTFPNISQVHHSEGYANEPSWQRRHPPQGMLEENVHPPSPLASKRGLYNSHRNEYPSYCPTIPPISIHDDASQQSFDKTRRYLKSVEHQEVATDSHPPCDAVSRRVIKDKDGSDIEQEWIEQYQGWLTTRIGNRHQSSCESIHCLDYLV